MATTTAGKPDPGEMGSVDRPNGILACLKHVPATEHGLITHWRAFGCCCFMSIGALLSGYDSLISAGLLSIPQFRADFGSVVDGEPILAASWQSAFNSISSIGCMFGALSLGWISDRQGRRGAVALACWVSIVGVTIQFFTPRHANWVLLVGKLTNGFAYGMLVSCVGSYCVEVSPLVLRGITTAAVNLWIVLGQFTCNGVIRGTGNRTDIYAYRIPFAIQWIFPVVLLIGLPFIPESPWWLIRNDRFEEAEKALVRLAGQTVDAKLQCQQIKMAIDLEDSYTATATYVDCFRGENLKRTMVAMMVFVCQQASGVVFVVGFSPYFFELAGFPTSRAFDLGLGITAIGVVGNLLAFYAVDRFGRRLLFNWGMTGCTVILFSIGFTWIWNANQNAKWAVSALTIVYNFVYQVSIGPLAYVIFAEVPSASLRSKTVGIGMWTNSLSVMVSLIIIPYLVNPNEANLEGYVGFVFGGLSLAGSLWSYFFIPETKGRTVDELDLLYERRVPARHFATYRLYGREGEKLHL